MLKSKYLSLVKEPQVSKERDSLIAPTAFAVETSRFLELALPRQDIADKHIVIVIGD